MHILLLHGAVGIWDEVVCLAVPATAIMGVALVVLRQQPVADSSAEDTIDGSDDLAPAEDVAGAAHSGRVG